MERSIFSGYKIGATMPKGVGYGKKRKKKRGKKKKDAKL
jgi:hypothetical protein